MKHRGRPARHLTTRRERIRDGLARLVCKVTRRHDPERRFTGDIICHRCRTGLGRWR